MTVLIIDCCTPVTDVVGKQRLRSATQQMTVVPRHRLSTVGRRAIALYKFTFTITITIISLSFVVSQLLSGVDCWYVNAINNESTHIALF